MCKFSFDVHENHENRRIFFHPEGQSFIKLYHDTLILDQYNTSFFFFAHLHTICDITYNVFYLFFYYLFTYLFSLGFGICDLLVFSVHLPNAHCFIFKCQLKRLILLSFIFLTHYSTFVLFCIMEKNNKFCSVLLFF